MYSYQSYIPSNRNFSSSAYSAQPNFYPSSNDRFIGGGFLGPFILGGITGGLIAPAFRPRPYPYYYPYYGPYYR